jgi:mediator of RNA polymerase II transcription subunit 10
MSAVVTSLVSEPGPEPPPNPNAMPPRPSLVPILVPTPAPDSPRSAQSVPPTGIQGDLEQDLMGLANALYNLGTTVVNDSTKDPGTGKQVGLRVYVHSFYTFRRS